ncbi:lipopolysaccharide biosynthesis protein [Aureivirga sp. CE67]|uniref:lipopolysaccharide biosynthesis protein n=1 Tax=Aureivirga sp. CE67 TaxID=1788983 RepID=UPI0018CBAB92|nr:lipopolysaccharide biosynthesis protein [Aureivirga sp. CE67]
MNDLKKKALNGVSWSFLDNIANSGITFLVGLVLANILSPAEFGMVGIITIFIAISNSIMDSGFSNALIRKKDATNTDYNTIFIFNLILGTILSLLLFISAPTIGYFFHQKEALTPLVQGMSIILIINSLGIVQRTLLVKKVDFKTQTKISLIASCISGIIGIIMALKGYGVWSLIAQQISRQSLTTIFLWIFNKWRPAFEFSIESFKELFGFGSKLLISGLIDTIYKNAYAVVIGKYYTDAQLGQYDQAQKFNTIFSSNLTNIIQRVSYPVLCKIQDEETRLKTTYQKVIKYTMIITFACMLGLAAVAKPLLLFLVGEKWLEATEYLQIICFVGMMYPLHSINLNILQVKGRTDLFLRLEIIKKIIAIGPIIIGIFFGIKFMLIGGVLTSFIAYFLNTYYSSDLINYGIGEQIKDIIPSFVVSLIVAFFMWSITMLNYPNWATLIIQIITGGTLAILIYELLKLPEYLEMKNIALSIIKRKKI